MTRKEAERMMFREVLSRPRLAGTAREEYWRRCAGWLGYHAEPCPGKPWRCGDEVLRIHARTTAEAAERSIERLGRLPEWQGERHEPETDADEVMSEMAEGEERAAWRAGRLFR